MLGDWIDFWDYHKKMMIWGTGNGIIVSFLIE